MSRIGKKPVTVVDGVKVNVDDRLISVEGPKGKLEFKHRPEVNVLVEDDGKSVVVSRDTEDRTARELHGLTRAVINNMILGVKDGYEKKLEVVGVGYLAAISRAKTLQLRVGFANELQKAHPERAGSHLPRPNAHRGSRLRQAKGWPVRRRGPLAAEA